MFILPPVAFGFLVTVTSVVCLSESFGEVEKKITSQPVSLLENIKLCD